MNNIRWLLNVLLTSSILSSITFSTIKIDIYQFLFILVTVWVFMIYNYNMPKNLKIFDLFILISLGNLIALIFVKEKMFDTNIDYILLSIIMIALFILSFLSFILNSHIKRIPIQKSTLFYKRNKDLERILYYLQKFDIIGINAVWGAGKSFLVDELKDAVKNEYEIIEIDVLSCNFNELQLILIKEIEKIMYNNKLISIYSAKLKSLLVNETIVSKLKNLIFVDNYSFIETIKGFQNELNKIDKKILIIYEDIDRISDTNIIKNIFALSEKLSNKKIKILYQYHEEKLKELNFTTLYLEKYIQFKINLTEIDFFEILELEFKEQKIDENILNPEDFKFLQKEYMAMDTMYFLEREFGINCSIVMDFFVYSNASIRRVKNFLMEVHSIISNGEYQKYKKALISFFFIKHFMSDEYDQLNINEGVVETFKFKFNSHLYTIFEIIKMAKLDQLNHDEVIEIFKDEHNYRNYCIINIFGYDLTNSLGNETASKSVDERLKLLKEEPINRLTARSHNMKIDRLIWSLLANGKSKYTNYEYVGKRFIIDVLRKPVSAQSYAFEQFWKQLFHQDATHDNGTIFMIGVPIYLELFKAFRVLNVTSKDQMALIDFYLKTKDVKCIGQELIENLNYCALKTNKEYIYILEKINDLEIIGNLNPKECFARFLKKFVGALSQLGYITTSDYHFINSEMEITSEMKKPIINELITIVDEMKSLKAKITSKLEILEFVHDLDVITQFIEKMIELITFENEIKSEKSYSVNTQVSSRYRHQDEYDRLKEFKGNKEIFFNEVRKSYIDEKISVYEIVKLLDDEVIG